MNHTELTELFKTFAVEHVDIRHSEDDKRFYVLYPDAIIGLGKSLKPGFSLIMEIEDTALFDQLSDNVMENKITAFHIVRPFSTRELVGENGFIGQCEDIAKQFISRIRKMHTSWNTVVKHIDLNSVSFTAVYNDLYTNNMCGCRAQFTMKTKDANLIYDPSKWLLL